MKFNFTFIQVLNGIRILNFNKLLSHKIETIQTWLHSKVMENSIVKFWFEGNFTRIFYGPFGFFLSCCCTTFSCFPPLHFPITIFVPKQVISLIFGDLMVTSWCLTEGCCPPSEKWFVVTMQISAPTRAEFKPSCKREHASIR